MRTKSSDHPKEFSKLNYGSLIWSKAEILVGDFKTHLNRALSLKFSNATERTLERIKGDSARLLGNANP
jgi:hypothetical protein